MLTPKYAVQLCLLNEAMKNRIFAPGKEGIAKTFMEGNGLPWEEKFHGAIRVFVGAYNIFSFNTLPP